MATSSSRPYAYTGVFLPVQTRKDDEGRAAVTSEWPTPRINKRASTKRRRLNQVHIAEDGFILVQVLRTGAKDVDLLLVQSVSTGALFMNKLAHRKATPPLELRISTASFEDKAGDQDPDAAGELPRDAKWCNQLAFWQRLDEVRPGQGPVYSMYFEYCNGGELDYIMEQYAERQLAMPEHFIWLVAEQLCLAIAWLYLGQRPDVPGFQQDDPWTKLYHRDIWLNNIWIHYPPKPKGRIPASGIEGNAFPQVILGDFGNSGKEGDPEGNDSFLPVNLIPAPGVFNPQELREWEDIYCVGAVLRTLCTTHISPETVRRPDPDSSLATISASASGPLPYSDRLLGLLADFEWAGMDDNVVDIVDVVDHANAWVASPQWCVDTLLPAAREELEAWRNPPGGRPRGHFEALDVSWTKPQGRMPMWYNPKYGEEADPERGQVDVDYDRIKDVNECYERLRMRRLRGLHAYNAVKPRYEVRSLEFADPALGVGNIYPPGADDAASSDS